MRLTLELEENDPHASRQGRGLVKFAPYGLPADQLVTVSSPSLLPLANNMDRRGAIPRKIHLVSCAGKRHDHDLPSYACDGGRDHRRLYRSSYTYVEHHRYCRKQVNHLIERRASKRTAYSCVFGNYSSARIPSRRRYKPAFYRSETKVWIQISETLSVDGSIVSSPNIHML